ncbi:MAG: glycosyl transferase, partial [Clostridia bacterium]|nr:glycosyl transferase [Clostridia bacterium]
MIPRTIHYCWFGGKRKPPAVERLIGNWRLRLPEYRIMEWNEENFNVENIKFSKEAYQHGKFAFVADIARLIALEAYGGIYLDTDVE